MDKENISKMPYTLKWETKERLKDPFQRALIEQLRWLNANLWEVRTNLAIMSNKLADDPAERPNEK